MRLTISILVITIFAVGCVTAIPQTANLSEAILITTKPAKVKKVALVYRSEIQDGQIIPCPQGTRLPQDGHPGFVHTEATTFGRMLHDYATLKFPALDQQAATMIRVTLKEFWIETGLVGSTGAAVAAAFFGGEINSIVIANVVVEVEIERPEGTETRLLRAAGEGSHVQGVGTGTSTRRTYRGKESLQYEVANAINASNNRILIMLNNHLDAHEF